MSGFCFGKISNVLNEIMDTDYVDIKREIEGKLKEVYTNVPCHVAYLNTDNPDATTVDVKPIIQSLKINFPNWVDIRNNDFIVAKKMDCNNSIIGVYSGRCGNPIISQCRKKIIMTMNATEPEPPSPIPPKNPAPITIQYFYEDTEIKNKLVVEAETGTTFKLTAPEIEGYVAINSSVDNVLQNNVKVIIPVVSSEGHNIKFIYNESNQADNFRFLVNGVFTKDNGTLGNGYHLYKKIKIDDISKMNIFYQITCENIILEHDDNGKILEIKEGAKIVLMPNRKYLIVKNILKIENNKITFTAEEYSPSEAEQKAYVTHWYDK